MTVIKTKPQTKFSTLSNQILQDSTLSIEAIGLWAHCMSRPGDWIFHISQLCHQFKIGKEKIHKIINELITTGYAFRGQKMEPSEKSLAGKRKVFSSIEYIFFSEKISKQEYEDLRKEYPGSDFKKSFRNGNLPLTENPLPESPLPENQPLQKKDASHMKEDTYKGEVPPAPPDPIPKQPGKRKRLQEIKIEVAPRVFLSDYQADTLKTRSKVLKIDPNDLYLKLSDWKIGKGITGGSNDFSAIVDWVIDAVRKDKETQSTKGPVDAKADMARSEADDRALVTQMEKKFSNLFKTHILVTGYNYIEFNLGKMGGVEKCIFGSAGFRDRCLKYLRSMNCDTSGL